MIFNYPILLFFKFLLLLLKLLTRGGRFELPWSETNGLAIHRRCRAGPSSQNINEYIGGIRISDKNLMLSK